jgi:transposase
MPTAVSLSERPAAIRVDLGAIFVSMELSRSKWLITSLSPGGGQKMSKHMVAGGDLAGLLNLFAALQAKARARTSQNYRTVVIQEAGLDGYWIGAGTPGVQAWRTAGLLDGQATQSRRGRSPTTCT